MENKIIELLVRQLQDVQDGSNWLDENFKKKLTGISEYEAFIRPIPEVHSVAELVAHLLIWRSEGIKKLQGHKSNVTIDSPENWRSNSELKEMGWDKLRNDFFASQLELIGLIKNHDDHYLFENEYVPGYSYYYLAEGLIQHDIYHLGQIGITIKLLRLQ